MGERLQDHYLSEIRMQAEDGLRGAEYLTYAVGNEVDGIPPNPQLSPWVGIHTMLSTAAVISSILWPGRDDETRDRTELLAILGLDRTSVLVSRQVRNRFEHVDERIERWHKRVGPNVNIVDRNFGDISGLRRLGVNPESAFRHFDDTTWVVSFQGLSINLYDVGLAFLAIKDALNERSDQAAAE